MNLLLVAVALAGSAQGPAPATVPMREEPYHRPSFENRYVAVYDVRLPVGAIMRYHEHPTNHLAVVIDSGRMRNEVVGRPPKLNPTGPSGTIVYLPAGPPHRQANIGSTTVHFAAIEVLGRLHSAGDSAGGPSPPPDGGEQRVAPGGGPGCRMVLERLDVRAWRCLLPPGQAAAARPRSGPFVRVAVTPGVIEQRLASGATRTEQVAAGTTAWHESPDTVPVKNAGSSPLEFVDIEWK
ncbi:MAG: cupin domain-containing protein [Gemmatimonadales bacterium]